MNIKAGQTVELQRTIDRHDLHVDSGQIGKVLKVFAVKQEGAPGRGTQHALVDFAGVKATVRLTSIRHRKDLP